MKTAAVVAFQFPKTAKRLSKLLQVPMAAEFNTQETAVPGAVTAKRPTVLFAATLFNHIVGWNSIVVWLRVV